MKCPDEDMIFSYAIQGELSELEKEKLKEHLTICESCRKTYESYVAMDSLLSGYWDGKIDGCFDTETLAKYSEGLLDEEMRQKVQEHISECKVCSSELELMKKMDNAADQSIEIPSEVDKRIYNGIMEKQKEILDSIPLAVLIKEDFIEAARRLTRKFISRYHESEQIMIEGFWKMLSPLYTKDASFGSVSFESGISSVVGDSKDYESPSIIFTMLGICDSLQDFEKVATEKELKRVILQSKKRFDISRREQRNIEDFLTHELMD